MKTYTNLLIFIILCFLIFDFFQMYSFKKNLNENLELISSQIADLDEDIHLLEDLIEKKKIQLIINTTSGKKSISDSFSIRRSAIRNKIPYFTTISAAKVAVTGLNIIKKTKFSVKPVQDVYK